MNSMFFGCLSLNSRLKLGDAESECLSWIQMGITELDFAVAEDGEMRRCPFPYLKMNEAS